MVADGPNRRDQCAFDLVTAIDLIARFLVRRQCNGGVHADKANQNFHRDSPNRPATFQRDSLNRLPKGR
jgi:hypothetical protein